VRARTLHERSLSQAEIDALIAKLLIAKLQTSEVLVL
jgi:hypothetical protein